MDLSAEKMAGKIDQISGFTVEDCWGMRDTIWAMNKENVSLADLQGRVANLIAKATTACPSIDFELVMDKNFGSRLLAEFTGRHQLF